MEAVAAICRPSRCDRFEILPGKSVVEIKPRGFDKGTGLREMMSDRAFTGRRPIFVGDDITDNAAFAVLPDFEGIGYSVGGIVPGAIFNFDGPKDVRLWLEDMSRGVTGGGAMINGKGSDYGLDLAVIGNGRTAALLEPSSRSSGGAFRASTAIRCSRRLLAGDEEKGFSDVVLDDLVDVKSARISCATPPIVVTEPDRRRTAARCGSPISRRASRISTASFARRSSIRIIEPIAGTAAHHHPLPADLRLRHADHAVRRSAAITSATGAATMQLRLTTDAPLSYIEREASFVLTRPVTWCSAPTSRFPPRSDRPAASSSTARATTGANGCAGSICPMTGRTR